MTKEQAERLISTVAELSTSINIVGLSVFIALLINAC